MDPLKELLKALGILLKIKGFWSLWGFRRCRAERQRGTGKFRGLRAEEMGVPKIRGTFLKGSIRVP